MKRTVRIVHISFLICFMLISLALVYWQVIRQPELLARTDNPRQVIKELQLQRGHLLARDGSILVKSQPLPDGSMKRVYLMPDAVPFTGYYSFRYGTAGAEQTFNTILRGENTIDPWDDLKSSFFHRPEIGNDVALTLDPQLQDAASRNFQLSEAAFLIFDARNGQLLAMLSAPTFDPNVLDEEWEILKIDRAAPLLNRPTQGLYPLGDLAELIITLAGQSPPSGSSSEAEWADLEFGSPAQNDIKKVLTTLELAPAGELGTPATLDHLSGIPNYQKAREILISPLNLAKLLLILNNNGSPIAPAISLETRAAKPVSTPLLPEAALAKALSSKQDFGNHLSGWSATAMPQETGENPISWFIGYQEEHNWAIVLAVRETKADIQASRIVQNILKSYEAE
jgi:hypothetical protein